MYTVKKKGSIKKHSIVRSFCQIVSIDDLYIGRDGCVWACIGYSSQVDDVAVQDLLISNKKCKKTITLYSAILYLSP